MDLSAFAGKNVLVMGLGRFGGGVDAAQFAARAGAYVTVTDVACEDKLSESVRQMHQEPNIELHLGSHEQADFERADIVIVNPAIAPGNPFLEIARRNGKQLTSQMGIFFQLCPARIVGITGANGKSTTTALTAHLLAGAVGSRPFGRVWLSGNIGEQPLLTILDRIAPDDVVVLELSSFQIEQLAEAKKAPHVALLTNLTPNHLDRYGTFAAYCTAKEGIFKYQSCDGSAPPVSIFNAEDEVACRWFDLYSQQPGRVCVKYSPDEVDAEVRRAYGLGGRAYLSNLAGAMAIARRFGVGTESVKACLPGFKALPHRLELVAQAGGVRWYNDSKATTPVSTIVALEAFDCPEIVIAGGYDKDLPFDDLGRVIARKAKLAILIGQTAPKLAVAIRAASDKDRFTAIESVPSLAEAVELANKHAVAGDVVLLSPACASYGMFANYQQRGSRFAKLARHATGQLSELPGE